jgi:hypothetical protein
METDQNLLPARQPKPGHPGLDLSGASAALWSHFPFFVHCLPKYIHVRMLDGSRCIGFYIESGNYWILTMAGHY